MSENPTVKEIVVEYLSKNGYEGLTGGWDCYCLLDDLMPCEEGWDDCQAGYLAPCDCDDCVCTFHISATTADNKETP